MSKVVNLNKRVKTRKRVKKSPHVLDLRKEKEKLVLAKEMEKKNKPQRVLYSAGKTVKSINQISAKKISKVKQIIKDTKEAINRIKIKINSSRPKFQPDASKLLAGRKSKRTKQESKLPLASKPTPLVAPFFIFRLKSSAVNVLLFLLFIAVLILPIRGFAYVQKLLASKIKIIDHATVAASYLQGAKEAGLAAPLSGVRQQFGQAESEFALAKAEVDEINKFTQILIKIIPNIGGTFKAGENVLVLGESLSKVGQYFTEVVDVLQNKIAGAEFPTEKLEIIKDNFNLALWQLQKANQVADEIDIDNLPTEYRREMSTVKEYLPQVVQKTEKLLHYIEVIQGILGHDELKRYLIIFQNNNEIRATGGFAGSYALIDFNQGKVENLEIPAGGSYDLEAGELENIIAPEPLQLINAHWHFWDANWFFDFPTSAEKLIEFYNSSGGPTVDGVIAVNATMLEELVGVVGSIEVSGYDEVINGENFIQLLQQEGYEHRFEKEPKKLLSLVGPKLLEKLTTRPESWLKILPILNKGLSQKDLQFYFSTYDLQREMIDLGWSGRILETSKDYLAVVHTNLGGGKTDQVITNEVWHSAKILDNGDIVNTVIITRTHHGQKGDPFIGVANNDYLRVYVPLGSKLISAYGFSEMPSEAFEQPEEGYKKDELIAKIEAEAQIDRLSGTKIFTESNKTVFANWLHLEPGETKSVYLKYRPPFVVTKDESAEKEYTLWEQISLTFNPKLQSKLLPLSNPLSYYSLLIQKQSGMNNTNFISSVHLPQDYKVVWSYPTKWKSDGDVMQFNNILNKDTIEVVVFE
jgi:hypothetical protein